MLTSPLVVLVQVTFSRATPLSGEADALRKHPPPTGRSGQGIFVHCVQWHEIHHRGEIYLMLGLMGMEAPDI